MKRFYTAHLPFFPAHVAAPLSFLLLGVYLWFQLSPVATDQGNTWETISLCGIPPDISLSGSYVPSLPENYAFADTGKITWTQVAPQPYGNAEAQATIVNNKMYVFGGYDQLKSGYIPTDRAYVFDPKANTWTPLKSMPATNGTGRGGVTHAGCATDGVDIYIAGGYTTNSAGTGQIFGTADAWKYNIASNTYTRLPNLPMPLSAGTLKYLSGKLHWVGGSNKARTEDLGVHYVLDLQNIASGWTTAAALPNSRNHLGAAVYDGKIYIFGGQHGHDSKAINQDDVHIYHPATNTWTQGADMPKGRSHIAEATLGSAIFILGGKADDETYSSSAVVAYRPASDTWAKYTDLPSPRASGVAGAIGGAIYYTSGSRTKNTYKGLLEIAPVTEALWLEAECATRLGSRWRTLSDAAASAGAYIAISPGSVSYNTAPAAPENIASFDFEVTQAGTYHLFARVKAPTIEDNSFWIRIDGGSWIKWSIDALTYDAFDWRAVRNSPFTFGTAGMHTIDVAYREDGTLLDKFYLSTSGTTPTGVGQAADHCTVDQPELWLEAECSPAIGANWVTASHTDASGGAYVAVRNGLSTGSTPPTGSADRVSFTFNIGEANTYEIFARVKAPNDQSNSFWIRIDGGQWLKWHISLTRDVFDWRRVRDASFTFSAGVHTLDVAYREDGTWLDKLYITATGTQPNGLGAAVASCAAGNTARMQAVPQTAAEDAAYADNMDKASPQVFPNPSDALFTVTLPGSSPANGWLTVWTLQGKMIKKVKIEDTSLPLTVDLSGAEAGIYVLQISTPGGIITKRIEKW